MALFKVDKLKELQEKEQAPLQKSHRILLVDDEAANLRLLTGLLEKEYDLLCAHNGPEALDILSKLKPEEAIHLIITDQRMPYMTGVEFLEKTLPLLPKTKRMVLTGYTDIDAIIDSINKGQIYKFILKPFDRQDMLLSVKRALEAYDLEDQTLRLNQELTQLNQGLEIKVEERTHEISQKAEIIEKQSIELRQLLHVLCHDLANPITSAISFLELARMNPVSVDAVLPSMQMGLNNALALINIIRKLRAVEENKLEIELDRHPLLPMVKESLDMVQNRLDQKHLQVELQIDPGLVVEVERASFINTVINNLLTNAIKFSFDQGKILIRGQVRQGEAVISIQDQGMGIPENIIRDLFNLTRPTSRQGTGGEIGTGFGMPLVKKFIELFGGRIEVQSKDKKRYPMDHGTLVELFLPLLS